MKGREAGRKGGAPRRAGGAKKRGAGGGLFSNRGGGQKKIIGFFPPLPGARGVWGIGFWTPELIREALRSAPPATRNWYVSMGTLLQDVGAFFGIYSFTVVTARIGRRPAFVMAYLIGLAATVMTFGWLRQPSDVLWMIPILGFCNLTVFGGFSIYFPELYPTRLRSTGVRFCYNVGRIVSALGPFTLGGLTVAFANAGFSSPFRAAAISLASIYLVGVFTMPFPVETRGKPLPEE